MMREMWYASPPLLVHHARLDRGLLEIERRVNGVGNGRLVGGLELEVAQRREELHREARVRRVERPLHVRAREMHAHVLAEQRQRGMVAAEPVGDLVAVLEERGDARELGDALEEEREHVCRARVVRDPRAHGDHHRRLQHLVRRRVAGDEHDVDAVVRRLADLADREIRLEVGVLAAALRDVVLRVDCDEVDWLGRRALRDADACVSV